MAKGKGSGKFKGKSEAGPAPQAPLGGMPPGAMPPGGMPPGGGPPPGMMGAPPGGPGATEIEIKIRPYKPEDHKEVVQLFRNAVTDDTLQVMMRDNPVSTRTRRIALGLSALLFFVIPVLKSGGDIQLVQEALWTWITWGLAFYIIAELTLDLLIWLDHGQLYVWNVVDNDMTDEALAKFTTQPNRLFVATDPNNPNTPDIMVGCVALYHEKDGMARLRRMAVQTDYRRAGVGKQLCKKFVETAKTLKYPNLSVETMSSRKAGLAMYKSIGFEEISDEGRRWFGNMFNMSVIHGITDVRMEMETKNAKFEKPEQQQQQRPPGPFPSPQ